MKSSIVQYGLAGDDDGASTPDVEFMQNSIDEYNHNNEEEKVVEISGRNS